MTMCSHWVIATHTILCDIALWLVTSLAIGLEGVRTDVCNEYGCVSDVYETLVSYTSLMPKDSLTNSFIVKIKWVNEALKITLQNIHTREVVELSTWPELFKELISQPTAQGQQVTLSQEALEQMRRVTGDTADNNDQQDNHDERDQEDDRSDVSVDTLNVITEPVL